MSTAIKWIIALVIVAFLGWLLWWSGWLASPAQAPTTGTATTTAQTAAAAQPQNGMSANNNDSNQALTQDSAAIDTQMQGLGSDSSNVDSSLNDQPGPESY